MMNKMKEDWIEVELGEVAKSIQYGYTESSSNKPIGPKFVRITDIQNNNVNWSEVPYCSISNEKKVNYLLQKDDLLFARTGATVGKSFLIKSEIPESVFASYLIRVRMNRVIIDVFFLSYFFNSPFYWQQITEGQVGIGQPNVNGTKLGKLITPIPPLPIQRAIVSKIEALFSDLDNGIANFKKAQEQLKIYRQAVLKKAFEGGFSIKNDELGITNKEGSINHTNQTKSESNDLPIGWKWVKLGEVIEKPKYGTSKKCDYNNGNVAVLRIPNISNGYIDNSDLKYAEFTDEEIKDFSLSEGDILTIRSNGSVDLVGKCALIKKTETKYLYAGYLIRLRPFKEFLNSQYLVYLMFSIDLRIQIESFAKSTSGVNNINAAELSNLVIPLPPTIAEQTQIVQEIERRLSVCENLEFVIRNSIEKAEALRQSILKKAFEGKLLTEAEIEQCKKEADYEPASELLKKITNEKLRMTNEKKAKKVKIRN